MEKNEFTKIGLNKADFSLTGGEGDKAYYVLNLKTSHKSISASVIFNTKFVNIWKDNKEKATIFIPHKFTYDVKRYNKIEKKELGVKKIDAKEVIKNILDYYPSAFAFDEKNTL